MKPEDCKKNCEGPDCEGCRDFEPIEKDKPISKGNIGTGSAFPQRRISQDIKTEKPPRGFDSWIKFYDWVCNKDFDHPIVTAPNHFTMDILVGVASFKPGDHDRVIMSVGDLRANCWKEIQEYRITQQERMSIELLLHDHMPFTVSPGDKVKIIDLLHLLANEY